MPSPPPKTTVFGPIDAWGAEDVTDAYLEAVFSRPEFRAAVRKAITDAGRTVGSIEGFLGLMRTIFRDSVRFDTPTLDTDLLDQLGELAEFERTLLPALEAYRASADRPADAIFWPNPKRDPEASIHKTVPFVRSHPLIDKGTPVGSAGSCFAFEIAYYLQERGYNYIRAEELQEEDKGIYADTFDPDNPYVRYSANWGILFNTPSFRQLAEKAFGERELPRMLVRRHFKKSGRTAFMDPFRENVFFRDVEAYEANYDSHLQATRDVFTQAEVFIITLGLNECWEYLADGSVISRNPSGNALQGLLRHRVLTVEENIDNIQTMFDLIKAHNPGFQLIVTLSPVPFLATALASEKHVVCANTHSKAVLRVAAEELVARNKDMYYLPSYEVVTVCEEDPWEADGRHVKRDTVRRIMDLFERTFLKPGVADG